MGSWPLPRRPPRSTPTPLPPKRRLSFVARQSGVLRYRTPVGDYDVTMPDGSVERITLTKFQEVSAGI